MIAISEDKRLARDKFDNLNNEYVYFLIKIKQGLYFKIITKNRIMTCIFLFILKYCAIYALWYAFKNTVFMINENADHPG